MLWTHGRAHHESPRFCFEFCHVEVKSSIGTNNRRFVAARVISVPPEKQLFIQIGFEISDQGHSLSEVVAAIKKSIGSDKIAIDILETLLAKTGYRKFITVLYDWGAKTISHKHNGI